jgi:hypothetical protein
VRVNPADPPGVLRRFGSPQARTGSRLGQFRRRQRPILCFDRGLQSGQTISNPTIRCCEVLCEAGPPRIWRDPNKKQRRPCRWKKRPDEPHTGCDHCGRRALLYSTIRGYVRDGRLRENWAARLLPRPTRPRRYAVCGTVRVVRHKLFGGALRRGSAFRALGQST